MFTKVKKYTVLFSLLGLPALCILFFASADHVFKPLAYFGPQEILNKEVNGATIKDTVRFTVPDFSFVNQDNEEITLEKLADKILIVNFFFTSCPTICPKATAQLSRVQRKTIDFDDVITLSHTVDPKRDTPEVLKKYAEDHFVDTKRWMFLTGEKSKLYDMAFNGYYLNAGEDFNAPGGFFHSDVVVLIDKDRHIRGIYQGTDTDEVDRLIEEVSVLKKFELIAKKEAKNGRN